jgi:predicted FMN-binding regulatory protein PaiB
VTVSGVPRDWLLEELGNAGIGLTVHWDDIAADPRLNQNRTAVDMAGTMLTLVTDQYTSREQMQYLVQTITEAARINPTVSRPAAQGRGPTAVSTQ